MAAARRRPEDRRDLTSRFRPPSSARPCRVAALLAAAATAAGCTGGHRYGVPRTLAPGEVSHHLSLDVGRHVVARGGGGDDATGEPDGSNEYIHEDEAPVPIPGYAVRVGLVDRLELGVGVALDTSAQVDLKVQLLRTSRLDLAVAPTVGGALNLPMRLDAGARSVGFVALPLLVGIRLGELTLVPAAAVGYLDVDSKWPPEAPEYISGGILWTGSVSAFFPVSDHARLGPGLTWQKLPGDDSGGQVLGGLTLALGDSPE